MKIGITHRLFFSILAASCLAIVAMFLIMQWSLDRGFLRYVNTLDQERLGKLVGKLEAGYAADRSWEPLRNDPGRWLRMLAQTLPDWETNPLERRRIERLVDEAVRSGMFPPQGPIPPRLASRFEMRVALLDAAGVPIYAPTGPGSDVEWLLIRHKGVVVGKVGLKFRAHLSDVHQLRFIREQKLAFGLVAAMVLLLSAVVSLPLAHRLVRPLRLLAEATNHLIAGRYDSRVAITTDDELGRLGRDFNDLAQTLEKNEQARRQWIADISHELRTPLAVLRGEIEALQDRIRQPTPESIASLHSEVLRLSRLVEDLHQLALSDVGALTYRKESLDLILVLDQVIGLYRAAFARKGITLEADLPDRRLPFWGDRERLGQLFTNLLDNSLKYTDPGGTLAVTLATTEHGMTIDLHDSAPGVAATQLERLFERLYRVENSRNRATGGAGLGLAICKNIVEAHSGSITAASSPRGGVWISVRLPFERFRG